jgi:FkbM family methyltransferase
MVSFSSLRKPQYFFRPLQVVRRLAQEVRPKRNLETVSLPWKLEIEVDTRDTVGNGIFAQGLYDIVTTEVLWRLTEPGDTAIDVGANIGYFTGLLAVRVASNGRVLAFEPHPRTAALLLRNVVRIGKLGCAASIAVHTLALSSFDGEATLDVFPNQEQNTSYAFLNFNSNHRGIPVRTARLEKFLSGSMPVGVLKIDAEWHEAAVLQGIGEYLRSGLIRDIVFEEHTEFPASSHKILMDAGYTIFCFEERFRGPKIASPASPLARKRHYDIAPSYLATIDAKRAERLLSSVGWNSFRGIG